MSNNPIEAKKSFAVSPNYKGRNPRPPAPNGYKPSKPATAKIMDRPPEQHRKLSVDQTFEYLEKYREFCVEYGRVFRESDLFFRNSETYSNFLSYLDGVPQENHWSRDAD